MAVSVLWLYLTVPWVGLHSVIVVFPDQTRLLFRNLSMMIQQEYLTAMKQRKGRDTHRQSASGVYNLVLKTQTSVYIFEKYLNHHDRQIKITMCIIIPVLQAPRVIPGCQGQKDSLAYLDPWASMDLKVNMRGSRGGQGVQTTTLKIHAITGSHHRPIETACRWRADGGPMVVRLEYWYVPPLASVKYDV